MANYVASLVSLAENARAAKGGNILRHVSTVGHATKVITKLATQESGTAAGKLCQALVDTFDKATQGSTIGSAVRAGVKLSRHTDPISAICGFARTVQSDTPARAFLEETASFMGMIITEGAMVKYAKDIANIKGINKLNNGLQKFCTKDKALHPVPAIVYGVLFCAGSALGQAAFKKAGTWVADKLGLAKSKTPPDNHKTEDGKVKYYWG